MWSKDAPACQEVTDSSTHLRQSENRVLCQPQSPAIAVSSLDSGGFRRLWASTLGLKMSFHLTVLDFMLNPFVTSFPPSPNTLFLLHGEWGWLTSTFVIISWYG